MLLALYFVTFLVLHFEFSAQNELTSKLVEAASCEEFVARPAPFLVLRGTGDAERILGTVLRSTILCILEMYETTVHSCMNTNFDECEARPLNASTSCGSSTCFSLWYPVW
ncbi:hypothetical protein T07_1573 [Trichinella nelsoni]|uniref:Secreted protein n=1 Tax=Trichinella nelsoni TaxID=6336 RepID=A0A0V0S646_9BILA|nr:hypothetical protein T07_1573 [Trichinella nelsoni]